MAGAFAVKFFLCLISSLSAMRTVQQDFVRYVQVRSKEGFTVAPSKERNITASTGVDPAFLSTTMATMTVAKVADVIVTSARLSSARATRRTLRSIAADIQVRTTHTCLDARRFQFEMVLINGLFFSFFETAIQEQRSDEPVDEIVGVSATVVAEMSKNAESSLRKLSPQVAAVIAKVNTAMNSLVQVACHGFSPSEVVLVDNLQKLDSRVTELEGKLIADSISMVAALGIEALSIQEVAVSQGIQAKLDALEKQRMTWQTAVEACANSIKGLAGSSSEGKSTFMAISTVIQIRFVPFFVLFELLAFTSADVTALISSGVSLLSGVVDKISNIGKMTAAELVANVLNTIVMLLDFVGNLVGLIPGATVNPAVKYTKLTLATISSLVKLANNVLQFANEQVENRQMRIQAWTARAETLFRFTHATCHRMAEALGMVREEKEVLLKFVGMALPGGSEVSAMPAQEESHVLSVLSKFCFKYVTLCAKILPDMNGQPAITIAAHKLLPQVQRLSHVGPITDFAVARTLDEKEQFRSFGFVDAFDVDSLRGIWEHENWQTVARLSDFDTNRKWNAADDHPHLMICRGCGDGVVFHAKIVRTEDDVADVQNLFQERRLRVCSDGKDSCRLNKSITVELPAGSTLNFVQYSGKHYRVAFYKATLAEVAKTSFGIMVGLDLVVRRREVIDDKVSEEATLIADCKRLLEEQGAVVMGWTATSSKPVDVEFIAYRPTHAVEWEYLHGYVKFEALTATFFRPTAEMIEKVKSQPGTTDWNHLLTHSLRQPLRFANLLSGCACGLRFPTQYSTTGSGVRLARLRSQRYHHLQDVRCKPTDEVWLSSAPLSSDDVDLKDVDSSIWCQLTGESIELRGGAADEPGYASVDELTLLSQRENELRLAASVEDTLVATIAPQFLSSSGRLVDDEHFIHLRLASISTEEHSEEVPEVTFEEFRTAALIDPVIIRMQDALCNQTCSFHGENGLRSVERALGHTIARDKISVGSSRLKSTGRGLLSCSEAHVINQIWGVKRDKFNGKHLTQWSQVLDLMFKQPSGKRVSLASDAAIPDGLAAQVVQGIHNEDCDFHWSFIVEPSSSTGCTVRIEGAEQFITFYCSGESAAVGDPVIAIMIRLKLGRESTWSDTDYLEDESAASSGFTPMGTVTYQQAFEKAFTMDRRLTLKIWKLLDPRIPMKRGPICKA